MIEVDILSVGLLAAGLPGWPSSLPVLRGEKPYQAETLPPLKPEILKANERRRTTQTIKLALMVADEALSRVERPADLLSVFASAEGDLDILNQICLALTQADRPVSPTQFHNSVHNAPAGYCSIGTGYREASISIAGQQGTFSAGLLEAAVQATCDNKPVLLVAYDGVAPEPLIQLIPNTPAFATALLLSPVGNTPSGNAPLARLKMAPVAGVAETPLQLPPLERLRCAQPSARSLPLLQALARREATKAVLPYLAEQGLQVEVAPC
jgi:hypothetical protein